MPDTIVIIIVLSVLGVLLIGCVVFALLWRRKAKAVTTLLRSKTVFSEDYKALQNEVDTLVVEANELKRSHSELKEANDKLTRAVYIDLLTGASNKHAFDEQLEMICLTLRNDEIFAIASLRIDDFYSLYGSLGSVACDQLIIDMYVRLTKELDSNDFIARIENDCFGIITQNFTDTLFYEGKVSRIKSELEKSYYIQAKEVRMSVSVGVAIATRDGKTSTALLKNMNYALMQAQKDGGNCIEFFNESISRNLEEQLQLQSAIREGLEQGAYEVCYQPKIDLISGEVNGFEALVRFNHPTQGVLLPESFLSVAEDTGLIVQIGSIVMRKCCEDLKSWGRPDITVAINLSPRQFSDIGLTRKVEEAIAEYGIDPHSLEFEISEAAALKNIKQSVEIIERFREMGISFSLDNFGTGYSSISFLKVLPVAGIKIDKTFIDSVSSNRIDKRVIETMILLAQNLELIVVAQGVERDEQDNFLKAIHCDKAQGYLYGEPISSAQVAHMLGVGPQAAQGDQSISTDSNGVSSMDAAEVYQDKQTSEDTAFAPEDVEAEQYMASHAVNLEKLDGSAQ